MRWWNIYDLTTCTLSLSHSPKLPKNRDTLAKLVRTILVCQSSPSRGCRVIEARLNSINLVDPQIPSPSIWITLMTTPPQNHFDQNQLNCDTLRCNDWHQSSSPWTRTSTAISLMNVVEMSRWSQFQQSNIYDTTWISQTDINCNM